MALCVFLLDLKNLKYISVIIFLSIMVFTVFQYMPLIEEENSVHVELTKKCKEGKESEGNDSNEPDLDCLSCYKSNLIINSRLTSTIYSTNQNALCNFISEINTPPPKI